MLVCQQSELVIVITSFSYTQHGRDVNAESSALRHGECQELQKIVIPK